MKNIRSQPCVSMNFCTEAKFFHVSIVKINESQYIVLFLVSGSIKELFPIDYVNIYLLSIFFLQFIWDGGNGSFILWSHVYLVTNDKIFLKKFWQSIQKQ